jgi:hypothetical protein
MHYVERGQSRKHDPASTNTQIRESKDQSLEINERGKPEKSRKMRIVQNVARFSPFSAFLPQFQATQKGASVKRGRLDRDVGNAEGDEEIDSQA